MFSIKEGKDRGDGKSEFWIKAGTAFVNRDGSLNVYLDVLPIDGKLHLREQSEKRETAGNSLEAVMQEAH